MNEQKSIVEQYFISHFVRHSKFLNDFKQLKTDEERFLFALKITIQHSNVWLNFECEQKSSEHSISSRRAGNESFASGRYYDAVQEYTKSIMYAINPSEELALGFANRSAALFELKKHADCVDDIDRALNLEYPDRLKAQLYKRKGLCLTALGRPDADASFQQALTWLDKMSLSEAATDRIKSKLDELILTSHVVAKPPENVMQSSFPKILSPNTELPSASDAIALKYSMEFGRHLVATKKIKPGEILAIEKPYCMRLYSDNIYKYCSYCLQVSWTMIPCQRCVNVAYCSEACQANAWDEYHEIECPVIELLRGFENYEMLCLSLRMVIRATCKGTKLDALKQELMNVDCNTDPRTRGFSSDGQFRSDKYCSVYSLLGNFNRFPALHQLVTALWVALTICVLARETEMFGEKLPLNTLAKTPNVVFVAKLILKNAYITFINVHSFGAMRSTNSSAHGHVLMPLGSLANHSCDPNTIRQWYSDRMALYAAYPIEEGEQIFDNYGPHYAIRTASERQRALKQWDFNCSCLPCREDWPLVDYLPSYKKKLLTRENKQKIDRAVRDFVAMHERLIKHDVKENAPKILDALLKLIEILFTLAKRPITELGSAVAMLESLYALADARFDYIPKTPSRAEENYSSSYFLFKHSVSQHYY